MASIKYFFLVCIRQPITKTFHKTNWQAASVIMAMFLFVAQLGYNTYDKLNDRTDEIFKIRVILLSEINNNLLALSAGGDETRIPSKNNICIPLPDNDAEAIKRVSIAVSYLHDDVYFSQLVKLSSLPKEEVDVIVKSYYSLSRLRTLSAQLELSSAYPQLKVKLMRDEYYNLYSLTESLAKYFSFHTEKP